MAYKLTFDLSKLPKKLFEETTVFCEDKNNGHKISDMAEKLVKKYDVDRLIDLSFVESKNIIEDVIDAQIKNKMLKNHFLRAGRKALFLPHCSRKYMDCNCKAEFKQETSSYECRHCSEDCIVNQATKYAKKRRI